MMLYKARCAHEDCADVRSNDQLHRHRQSAPENGVGTSPVANMPLRIEPLTPPRIDPRIETGMPSWVTSLVVILLVAAILRLAALVGFEGTIQDGVGRVGTARAWIFDGVPTFGRTLWPEGNYLLPAAALLCWDDPYWSVRILYAIIGLT